MSDGQSAEDQYYKGIEYGVAGKFEEAQQQFKKALEADLFYMAARECLKLSEDVLKQTIKVETALYSFKGTDYANKRMFDEAITECKKAIEINPNLAEVHSNLGVAYANKGMYDEAIAELEKAIEINPNYTTAHVNLAVAYYHKGEYSLAIKHCDKAIELGCKVHPKLLELLEPHRER